jgi:hypothetical protein
MTKRKLSEKDKQALKAAEDYVINQYTMLTRSTIKQWDLDPEDAAKLQYNDNPGKQDGYLIAGVASSRIVDYDAEQEIWTIEVVPDIGIDVDPEVWDVYQINGEWIVEHL